MIRLIHHSRVVGDWLWDRVVRSERRERDVSVPGFVVGNKKNGIIQ